MRKSGILMHISSLPSEFGIGKLGDSAYMFANFLRDCGVQVWQILPLSPTSYGDSPYQSFSTFAGNPYFISLEELIKEGLLTREECEAAQLGTNPSYVDYGKQYENRDPLLHKAYENSKKREDEDFLKFEEEQKEWLAQNTEVCLGSDAFFPFGDNIERAHKSGVQYIAEPGGSIRDDHVIATCNKYNMALAFTGIRLFHH